MDLNRPLPLMTITTKALRALHRHDREINLPLKRALKDAKEVIQKVAQPTCWDMILDDEEEDF